VYAGDGTSVGNIQTFTGTSLSASRTVTASTDYYIMVYHYSTGTYQIGLNAASTPPAVTVPTTTATALTADSWSNGNIAAAGGEQWFSLPATASSHYIHFQPGTGTDALIDVVVRVYAAAGTTVGSTTNLTASSPSNNQTGLTSGTTYYIRVKPYFVTSKGAYKIGFNSTQLTPVVLTSLPSTGVTQLTTINTWVDGNIPAVNGEQWFKFTSTVAGSQYIYFQPGPADGGLTSAYAYFYTTDGRQLGGREYLTSGTYTSYGYRTVTNSTEYYVKVTPYTSTGKGTYKLAFGTTTTTPTAP